MTTPTPRDPDHPYPRQRIIASLLICAASLAIPTIPGISPKAVAQSKPRQVAPPLPTTKFYEPDEIACQQQTIENAYRSNLRPWADQPEEVLARLRTLQGEMTRSSLERCVSKGLMSADQAKAVEQRLSLPTPTPGRPAQSTSTTRP